MIRARSSSGSWCGPSLRPSGKTDGAFSRDRAAELTVTHDLAPRIAARIAIERLQRELGQEGALELAKRQLVAEALGERLVDVAREIAATLESLGVPLVLLKFVALRLLGHVAPGTRTASDLDVLVPASSAPAVRRALLASGCRDAARSMFPIIWRCSSGLTAS